MNVHHIGYLVKNIAESISEFKKLGFNQNKNTVNDALRQINICFMEKDGYVIELVSPSGFDSPFYGLLKKHKNSPYHICYVSDEFEADIDALLNDGYMLFQPPLQAPAIGNKRVCFMMNAEIGMIELLERC